MGARYTSSIVHSRLHIGCSGWSYDHWRGDFYPENLAKSKWFSHYATQFSTVEVNATFYHLPRETTWDKWRDAAPDGFIYAIKLWRQVTHRRRLADAQEPLSTFLRGAEKLGERLGSILVQLPPGLHADHQLLSSFLSLLPRELRFAFEFRHRSWYEDETYRLLEKHGCSFVLHDYRGRVTPRVAVGPFIYLRFHGPEGDYQGGYSREALSDWANWLREQAASGRECFAYFNNDIGGHAPRDAKALTELVGESP